MRRVLVPLDGSPFAESIILDARRAAGADGTLILVCDAGRPTHDLDHVLTAGPSTFSAAESYLDTIARLLRKQGVDVEVHVTFLHDIPLAIVAAAEMFKADMIACATHGRTVVGRLVHGGAAWQALAGSTVPILLRHGAERSPEPSDVPRRRRIMVPLDGSSDAENALPLAQELAREWRAEIVLARVVTGATGLIPPFGLLDAYAVEYQAEIAASDAYLNGLAATLIGDVQTHTCCGGDTAGSLTGLVEAEAITDVVMTSHGRTGLSRVVLGSVTDSLIHRLHLPIIVIPALVSRSMETRDRSSDHVLPMASGTAR